MKNKFVGILYRGIYMLHRGGFQDKKKVVLTIARKYLKGNFTQELHANYGSTLESEETRF